MYEGGAKKLGVPWRRRYKTEGLAGAASKKMSGRPKQLTAQKEKEIVDMTPQPAALNNGKMRKLFLADPYDHPPWSAAGPFGDAAVIVSGYC
jgi:transposase